MTTTKPKLTTRGRAVLVKAFAAMRKWPDSVNMGDRICHDENIKSSPRRPAPYCGTVACFAGHVALAATRRRPDVWGDSYSLAFLPKYIRARMNQERDSATCSDVALAALDVPKDEWDDAHECLFATCGWPLEFKRRYKTAKTPRARASATIARVRYWLKTGK